MSDVELPVALAPDRLISYLSTAGHFEPPEEDDGLATAIDLVRVTEAEAEFSILITLRLSRQYAAGFAEPSHAATVLIEQPDSGRSSRLRTVDPRKRYPPASDPAYAPAAPDPRRKGTVTHSVVVPCLLDRTLAHDGNLFITTYLHHLRSNTLMVDLGRAVVTSYRNDRPEEPRLADDQADGED